MLRYYANLSGAALENIIFSQHMLRFCVGLEVAFLELVVILQHMLRFNAYFWMGVDHVPGGIVLCCAATSEQIATPAPHERHAPSGIAMLCCDGLEASLPPIGPSASARRARYFIL
jgi:hypothetical protein